MAEYYFKLPRFDELTITQQAALKPVGPIALSGGPGTGKSVVSLYRHIARNAQGKNCQLLTYTTTLGLYLKQCCATQNTQAAEKVGTTLRWSLGVDKRDEIIVDEAQDIDPLIYKNRLDLRCNKNISYGADDAQSVFPVITDDTIERLFGNTRNKDEFKNQRNQYVATMVLKELYPNNQSFLLTKNYRNTKSILLLARNAFPNANISLQDVDSCQSEGNKPIMFISGGDIQKRDDIIIKIINSFANTDAHNISILCPWRDRVIYYYNLLREKFPKCTRYYEDNNDFPNGAKEISNIHITTFKSAKGLEFDTVIIPDFQKVFEYIAPRYRVDWKDFYVGVTRAKTNLYLISRSSINQITNFVEVEK